jgi:heterodisulfide reductase subunit A-like polyferredoxin
MQNNNGLLFPEQTNRPGIFVAGACRGRTFLPEVASDARATALRVHEFLAQGALRVEPGTVEVDADKCAVCLTCVRSCPHRAMIVNPARRAAIAVPGVCQRCGVCVAECPARALTLPVVSV